MTNEQEQRERTAFWATHFESNHRDRPAICWELWEQNGTLGPTLRRALIASLQRFQVGESGDGQHLKRGAARVGRRYAETIARFIGEEQEHSRWLARCISLLGGTLLTHHWSDSVFVWLRRLCGLRVELMVLLVAEMIAMRYYRALYEGTGDPVLRAVFGQICRDEDGHVAFHIDFLRAVFARCPLVLRAGVRLLWRIVYRLACALVLWDHRAILRETGVRPADFWHDTGEIFDRTANGIFEPGTAAERARTMQTLL